MVTFSLQSLVSKLNESSRKALELAVALTMTRSHYYCEIEHWILKLLEIKNGDWSCLFQAYGVEEGTLVSDIESGMRSLKTGNNRSPALAVDLVKLISRNNIEI